MNATLATSPKNRPGFTLVEVMMAMLVMTVGLLGLLQSVNVAYEHNLRNRLREQALVVGEEQMNLLRSRSLPVDTPYLNRTTVVRVLPGLQKSFTVTSESEPMSTTQRLKVTVRWGFKNLSTTHVVFSLKKT
jgi:type IV pilus assembly protein PilV